MTALPPGSLFAGAGLLLANVFNVYMRPDCSRIAQKITLYTVLPRRQMVDAISPTLDAAHLKEVLEHVNVPSYRTRGPAATTTGRPTLPVAAACPLSLM